MARCVKTGAKVHFQDYGCVAHADLFEVGDTMIINLGGEFFGAASFDWRDRHNPTHILEIGDGYFHKEKGIAVVPREALQEL